MKKIFILCCLFFCEQIAVGNGSGDNDNSFFIKAGKAEIRGDSEDGKCTNESSQIRLLHFST
jgi:hypothetical protein